MSFLHRYLLLAFLSLGFSYGLYADTVKANSVKAALDSPVGIEFGDCTNSKVVSSYSDTNINGVAKPVEIYSEDEDGNEILLPNPSFLQLTGGESPVDKERSGRIKSAFSFRVAGAGILSFAYRVATFGWNDDILVFYEDDIDDFISNEEYGGDYWYKKYTEDGETYWGLDLTEEGGDEFFGEGSMNFDTTKYFHTVHVALLAPQKEDYEKPSTYEEDAVIKYLAWLDYFSFEADESVEVCSFSEEDGSTFSNDGLDVVLDTDYIIANMGEHWPVLTFYYTLDGKQPTTQSTKYDFDSVDGIHVGKENLLSDGLVHLRVAAYEGDALVGADYQATYSMREAPGSPICSVASQGYGDFSAEVTFHAKSAATSLQYYYTLDGSEPTLDSPTGRSVCISQPCVLSVKAYDEGAWSEKSVFQVKRLSAPDVSVLADGIATAQYVFDDCATVSLEVQSQGMAYYRLGDAQATQYLSPVEVRETSSVEFQTVYGGTQGEMSNNSTIWLNGVTQVISLRKTGVESSDWLTEQLSQENGWNLVGIKRFIAPATGKELANAFSAFEHNTKNHTFTHATAFETGKCYWIYGNNYEIPATIPCVNDQVQIEAEAGRWTLVPENASYVYQKAAYQRNLDSNDAPGWKKSE